MTLWQEVDAMAQDIAAALGRDWNDCGEYERERFREEARRQMCQWITPTSHCDEFDGYPPNSDRERFGSDY